MDELPDLGGCWRRRRARDSGEKWSTQASVADLTAYEEALLATADRHAK